MKQYISDGGGSPPAHVQCADTGVYRKVSEPQTDIDKAGGSEYNLRCTNGHLFWR